jgi:Zn finger protein HypA/HybF involved in hydrogenase expression
MPNVDTRRRDSLQTMHELSIALSLLDTIADELPKLGDVRVLAARVRVGALSGVAADALSFAFDVASESSPIAGATLAIERTNGTELELVGLEVADVEPADR